MSHNDNVPERAARRHSPAIIGILVALVLAALAFVVFGWTGGDDAGPARELAPGSAAEPAAPVADPSAAPATTTAPATN